MKENTTSVYYPVKRSQSQLHLAWTGCAEQPFPSHSKHRTTLARTAASLLITETLPLWDNCCIMYHPNTTGDCSRLENLAVVAALRMTNNVTTESWYPPLPPAKQLAPTEKLGKKYLNFMWSSEVKGKKKKPNKTALWLWGGKERGMTAS